MVKMNIIVVIIVVITSHDGSDRAQVWQRKTRREEAILQALECRCSARPDEKPHTHARRQ